MRKFDPERREMIRKVGMLSVGTLAARYIFSEAANAASPNKTPSQPEGPFYPVVDQVDKDTDMTQIRGHVERARGQVTRLNGKIIDTSTGAVVSGAIVEFWQACESGKYNHPNDPNTAELDPHFQYWAQARSSQSGEFSLITIKPGAYRADDTWTRPPHIHVKVHKPGYPTLTTQIYFAGDPLNASDQILNRLSAAQRKLVEIDFTKSPLGDYLEGFWTIYIAPHVPGRLINTDKRDQATTPDLEF